MSKTMRATPIWLVGACSDETFLSDRLAVIPNSIVEHLSNNCCGNLKYVQAKSRHYKHAEALGRKSGEFVHKILFYRGGKLR
jgi:hypothetical protein